MSIKSWSKCPRLMGALNVNQAVEQMPPPYKGTTKCPVRVHMPTSTWITYQPVLGGDIATMREPLLIHGPRDTGVRASKLNGSNNAQKDWPIYTHVVPQFSSRPYRHLNIVGHQNLYQRSKQRASKSTGAAKSEQRDLREAPPEDTPRLTLTYRHALLIALPALTQEYFRFTLTLTHKDSDSILTPSLCSLYNCAQCVRKSHALQH